MAWELLENGLPWMANRAVEAESDTGPDTDSGFNLHELRDGALTLYPAIESKNRGYALDSSPLARYIMPQILSGDLSWMSSYNC